MKIARIVVGVLLALGCAWALLMVFAFATLAAGGLEDGDPAWWPTVLGVTFRDPATFVFMAGMTGGVGLCLYRPERKATIGGLTAAALVVLLGLFLWTAGRERLWMVGRSANPDGTKHVVREYRDWFGRGRTVESDEP